MQGAVLELEKIHSSHDMKFQPCLFLECANCMTSAKHGAKELALPCTNPNTTEKRN